MVLGEELLDYIILKISCIWATLLMSSKTAMMQADTVFYFFCKQYEKFPDLEHIIIVNFLHQVAASCSSALIIPV